MLYHKNAVFRTALKTQLLRYVPDEVEAEHLAWLFMFVGFGYGQMMITLDLQSATNFDPVGFIDFLADRAAAGHG